ncbi:MAG: phage head morphogenesis protein [Treponema sp.]|jgi:SPP1 gp7 family putative phage head morphogenesis protein|nr:phage head morphogenesis protein [Treponema sp.]
MPSVSTGRFPAPVLAEEFLEKKIDTPTERWDDLKWGEHAHAFTVAHSNEAAVLDAIQGLLNKAMREGVGFQSFRKGMLDMMKEKGWYGGAGHTGDEKRYINWRVKTIYETNMRTAYAQAQYRKQVQGAGLRPIWVYQSQLSGNNRRQEHLALHGKAYRYDDAFWDRYYPPNGWGCRCYVTTKSEAGAEREGITAGDSTTETLPDIDGTWAYNAGREALAPNFAKYTNLPKETLKQIYAKYHRSMDGTRMTEGEFKTLITRTAEADYKPLNVNYQVGNLEAGRFEAMRRFGVRDSKIMATDHDLWHGTDDKNAKRKIPKELFNEVYQTLQEPEMIYRAKKSKDTIKEIHFVKKLGKNKVLKIVLKAWFNKEKETYTALRVITMGVVENNYGDTVYEKIW